jgi:hypothetical protein
MQRSGGKVKRRGALQARETQRRLKRYQAMRTITLLLATATAISTFASSAKADRVCSQTCEAGVCQPLCFDSDHVYLDNADKDFYLRHGRPDAFTGQ